MISNHRKLNILTGSAFLLLSLVVLLGLAIQQASAAPMSFFPLRLIQPDGAVLDCFASGDEYYNWLHDANGYTILQDPQSGYYVYALQVKGKLIPSSAIAGKTDPTVLGVQPWLKVTETIMTDIRNQLLAATPGPVVNAPTLGSFTNLAIFIRFADEAEWTAQYATYNQMFNNSVVGANSLYNYFMEASYGAVSISTQLYPIPTIGTSVISYQDRYPRAYYRPYNAATADSIGYQGGDNGSERRDREHALLKAAVDSIGKLIPPGTTFDADGDGYVDNVVFIVSGSPTGWSSLLWPHAWSLYSVTATVNGKRVYRYNLQLQASINVGVLCHEMYHTLGSPDLYHYSKPGTPVGSWDIMATSVSTPMHMGAYMKYKYGRWIPSLPTIAAPGRYTLNPVTSPTNNIYKIASPYSTSEFFVVEYRKKVGTFENSLPGEGLLVYRINSSVGGNASGPPDEVYIYRPGGTLSADGTLRSAAFSNDVDRTMINDQTDPMTFLTSGSPGGLMISAVGTRGDTIGFALGVPLPAAIDSFTAVYIRADSIKLSWVAKAQYRAKSFELERSDSASSGFFAFGGNSLPASGTIPTPVRFTLFDRTNPGVRYYRIKEVDSSDVPWYSDDIAQLNIPTAIAREIVVPERFQLAQNYPNPFNPTTVIEYSIAGAGGQGLGVSDVRLIVYDLLGREVAVLVNERKPAGRYEVKFDAAGLSTGFYIYRLTAGQNVESRKMVFVK
jgi:M6 family metalloprotease-like protein